MRVGGSSAVFFQRGCRTRRFVGVHGLEGWSRKYAFGTVDRFAVTRDNVHGGSWLTVTARGQQREAGCLYCFPREGRWLSSARSRGIVLQPTPHPAYGSEFSTDGNRLVRALEGNGAGCRFTPRPVLQAAGPFPVSSTAPHYRRTKSESQGFFGIISFTQGMGYNPVTLRGGFLNALNF